MEGKETSKDEVAQAAGPGGKSGWLGPLFLAGTPFLLFALLVLLDRLLR